MVRLATPTNKKNYFSINSIQKVYIIECKFMTCLPKLRQEHKKFYWNQVIIGQKQYFNKSKIQLNKKNKIIKKILNKMF